MKSRMTLFSLLLVLLTWFLFAASVNGSETAVADNPSVQQQDVVIDIDEESLAPDRMIILKWLHLLDEDNGNNSGKEALFAHISKVPGDLSKTFQAIGQPASFGGFMGVLLRSILALAIGFFIAIFISKMGSKNIDSLNDLTPQEGKGQSLLALNIIKNLPDIFALIVFVGSSIVVFLLLAGDVSGKGRMLFQLILGFLFILQLSRITAKLLLSPNEQDRFITVDTQLAGPLSRAIFISMSVLASTFLIGNFIFEIGLEGLTLRWCVLFLGSAVIAIYALLVLNLKQPVVNSLLAGADGQKSWLKQRLYAYWHVPSLFYLLCVWILWIGQQVSGEGEAGGSFLISMMLVPIYFVLSSVGKMLISSTVDSLGIVDTTDTTSTLVDENAPTEKEISERRESIISKCHTFFRVFVILALLAWVMALWGYKVPFASVIIKALFESIVIIAVALLFWRFASSYIQNKIEDATSEVNESEENADDEFGGAVPRGRSHTLLPMVRKVLGSILVVMVVLIVISSMGVDIGPLLAGAGVIGLAVGFGAQKLVSDIFSGFFFLLDDAFRVGEYIQAGSVKGTVEAITLRNVMLRHHLGMLQIVPHSDLGAITNCMRGGMVIKFPLEFPYDADIDKVRKIIKKVGQAMLQDEELGDDFILPLKSQGVSQITNSVMVIRVKFTSKPGKQFVIRREAFRRITEALNAKGIYYAHRKVIVDIPPDSELDKVPEGTRQKVLQAGAATLSAQASESEAKKESGMFE